MQSTRGPWGCAGGSPVRGTIGGAEPLSARSTGAPQALRFLVPPSCRIESTFEVYIESERLYLFGLDCPEAAREWLKSIAKVGTGELGAGVGGRGLRADGPPVPPPQSFVPPHAEELLSHDFERIGRLLYKGGLNLERAKEGWFALAGSTLYVCFEDSERHEALQLRKLQELCRCPVPPRGAGRGSWGGGQTLPQAAAWLLWGYPARWQPAGCSWWGSGGFRCHVLVARGPSFGQGASPGSFFLFSILFLVAAHPAWAGAGRLLRGSCLPSAAIQGDNEVLVLVERRR